MERSDDIIVDLGKGQWWGDCQPYVRLLRAALLSETPELAVVAPLHGCFVVYMNHLQDTLVPSLFENDFKEGVYVPPLEAAFTWLGGWRPTTALTLVYSLMGIEVEDALKLIQLGCYSRLKKFSRPSFMSAKQLSIMHILQKRTIKAENRLSSKLASIQMLVADKDVLVAITLDSLLPALNGSTSRLKLAINKRHSRLKRLGNRADELRLHTLHDLMSILTPVQAAHASVAAFELCFSVMKLGVQRPIVSMVDSGPLFDDRSLNLVGSVELSSIGLPEPFESDKSTSRAVVEVSESESLFLVSDCRSASSGGDFALIGDLESLNVEDARKQCQVSECRLVLHGKPQMEKPSFTDYLDPRSTLSGIQTFIEKPIPRKSFNFSPTSTLSANFDMAGLERVDSVDIETNVRDARCKGESPHEVVEPPLVTCFC